MFINFHQKAQGHGRLGTQALMLALEQLNGKIS